MISLNSHSPHPGARVSQNPQHPRPAASASRDLQMWKGSVASSVSLRCPLAHWQTRPRGEARVVLPKHLQWWVGEWVGIASHRVRKTMELKTRLRGEGRAVLPVSAVV